MISSFFGKTKPINYIVLSVFLFLFYSFFHFFIQNKEVILDTIPLEVLTIGVLLFTIFIINYIVRAEKVTDFSSYAMLFFVFLIVAFSDTIEDKNAIFCNFFLLLMAWRLLSIRSLRNVKHRLFDASFLIGIASLFYDWALLYLALIFLVINVYDRKTVKNWLVPLLGLFTVFILTFTILKTTDNLSFFAEHYTFSIDTINSGFFSEYANNKLIVYALLMLILMLVVFLRLRQKGGGKLVVLRIVFLFFIVGVIVSIFKPKGASPILITFFPVAVFLTNYLETIRKTRLRELAFGTLIFIPILVFLLEISK
ncbi:DUF6427 family protein [Flagellimonas eckloniae]|uniref:Beta-carotene 15,15'-monooxygenase n=1 Tax=Flagellimonas eckloniae TaxID=346185 RepID=A0A0Q1CI02_9FLAO|nr:DUF6427 family protein [Allomuricauda eckloniae]KQC30593.1 hypothetical protein AAY42_12450 [Allomuricauda eckloniae]